MSARPGTSRRSTALFARARSRFLLSGGGRSGEALRCRPAVSVPLGGGASAGGRSLRSGPFPRSCLWAARSALGAARLGRAVAAGLVAPLPRLTAADKGPPAARGIPPVTPRPFACAGVAFASSWFIPDPLAVRNRPGTSRRSRSLALSWPPDRQSVRMTPAGRARPSSSASPPARRSRNFTEPAGAYFRSNNPSFRSKNAHLLSYFHRDLHTTLCKTGGLHLDTIRNNSRKGFRRRGSELFLFLWEESSNCFAIKR